MSAKKRDGGRLIRQDLEPVLIELLARQFKAFDLRPAIRECLRCRARFYEYADADPYYCEACRPKG